MIKFDKETLKKLEKFEQYFHTVLDLQYIRATSRDMLDLLNIYELAGGVVKNFSSSCYQCRYNLVKEVGLAYRNSVKELEKEQEKEKEQNSEKLNIENNEPEVLCNETSPKEETKPRKYTKKSRKQ